MRANDRQGAEGDLFGIRRNLAAGMRNAGQRRFDAPPTSLNSTRPRISVIVSRPIRVREGAAPIRRVLIFDDHPATLRLMNDIDRAQRRKDRLALLQFSALILLLLLVMFWRVL